MKINTNTLNKIRYTLYAPAYDWAAAILNKSRQRSIQSLNVQLNDSILIVGAGTGMDLDYLPNGCKIEATDITTAMVQRILKRNITLNHNLTALVMDGQQLTYPEHHFDKIILHLILAVIPDPIITLQEAERVLKQGGTITIYDKFLPTNKQLSITRKTINLFTNLFFSNITRKFEDIVKHTNLKVISDEKADLGGNFRIIKLQKTA